MIISFFLQYTKCLLALLKFLRSFGHEKGNNLKFKNQLSKQAIWTLKKIENNHFLFFTVFKMFACLVVIFLILTEYKCLLA
jgi:hypothetical protein